MIELTLKDEALKKLRRTHNWHNIPHCGECPLMKHESTDGYGWCDSLDMEVRCSDKCYFGIFETQPKYLLKLLHYHQKWRRGKNSEMLSPWLVGLAIDETIRLLRKINKEQNQ